MRFRFPFSLAVCLALTGCTSGGLYRWVPFAGRGNTVGRVPGQVKSSKRSPFGPVSGRMYYGLEMRLQVVPDVVRVSQAHTIEAHLSLINRTKKTINLRFNDSRHADFILRDASGRKLVQWSDDQPVSTNPGYVIVNPNERAEFVGNLSTRDMVAGRTYEVEGFVNGYDQMHQVVTIQAAP
jgi:Intracellular proteinase inhibitor